MAAKNEYVVTGEFGNVKDAIAAVRAMRAAGHEDRLEVFSPIPEHHLEEALYEGRKRSPVRRFVLLGGLTGCLGAFLFTSWMSVDYPLRVSAKPLISIPAFVVIAFECTILLGGISNLLSMFHFSRVPSLFRPVGYRPVFSEGHFGVSVRASKEQGEEIGSRLSELGAEGVEVKYVR
ncbi:MAG: DUF3341 domain-containing protein [Bdellovibrionales bacterium]|nr:DUF3341 domain-containing protein [Bdellovibrionales bacterium]